MPHLKHKASRVEYEPGENVVDRLSTHDEAAPTWDEDKSSSYSTNSDGVSSVDDDAAAQREMLREAAEESTSSSSLAYSPSHKQKIRDELQRVLEEQAAAQQATEEELETLEELRTEKTSFTSEGDASTKTSDDGKKRGKIRQKLHEVAEKTKHGGKVINDELHLHVAQPLHKAEHSVLTGLAHGMGKRFEHVYEYGMAKILVATKEQAQDPYMPAPLRDAIDSIIDMLWPDVKNELKSVCLANFRKHHSPAHGTEPQTQWDKIRAKVKYTLYPYDRTIWRRMHDPLWWVLTLVSILPFSGVPELSYIALFFMIDKSDEYQLFQYIARFKTLQFVAYGAINMFVGAFRYYWCTSTIEMTCDRHGPREEPYTILFFFMQIFTLWLAFGLSFRAKKKGGRYYQKMTSRSAKEFAKHKNDDPLQHQLAMRKLALGAGTKDVGKVKFRPSKRAETIAKRRMLMFLMFDLVVCGLTILAFMVSIYNELVVHQAPFSPRGLWQITREKHWRLAATLFWIRTVHGLLSVAFLPLMMPAISAIVTPARPTSYNPWGHTVPYVGEEEPASINLPWRPAKKKSGKLNGIFHHHEHEHHHGKHHQARKQAEKEKQEQSHPAQLLPKEKVS